MRAVYYTQNLRDLLWVQPIWQETGGAFCSELPETARHVHDFDSSLPFEVLHTPTKLTIGRAAGGGQLSLKRKAVRLRLAHVARRLKPDVIITTSNHRHAIRRDVRGALAQGLSSFPHVKQVQAFHGVSSKNVKFNPWMAEYDLLLLPGRRERDKFAAMGVLDKVKHALIGHPKADRVLRGELTRQQARAELGLQNRPTVLYAPTHGALSSFYKWGLQICAAVPSECNLIVKPHPSLLTTIASDKSGAEAIAAVTQHLARRGGLWLPFEPDVMPAMAASDLLVTDYSSVAEEYLVFDRPLIFADHLAGATGRDRAQRDKGDWHGIFGCGLVVTQVGAVPEAVAMSLAQPENEATARRALRDYVFENLDGHCAKRAAEAIRELV
ncbi:MAG TPA: CDP-glycerol glycerophosphotransferase family protein [Abditibacteriaceae bacterium]|jgi:hypothetical protein